MNSAIRNRITRALIGILAFAALLIVARGSAFAQENSWNLPPSPASAVRTPADDAITVTSDKFITERPTLISAGFEWMIHGDSNRNAKVEVTFPQERAKHVASRDAADAPAIRIHQEVPKATRQTTLHPPILNYVRAQRLLGKRIQPRSRHGVRIPFRAQRSRRRQGRPREGGLAEDPRLADAGEGWQRLSRVPRGLDGAKAGACFCRASWRLTTWERLMRTTGMDTRRACDRETRFSFTPASTRTLGSATTTATPTQSRWTAKSPTSS